MFREKPINNYSCRTLYIKKFCNKKLAYLTEAMRLVKPALEDLKNGNYISMEEFGAHLDALYVTYD